MVLSMTGSTRYQPGKMTGEYIPVDECFSEFPACAGRYAFLPSCNGGEQCNQVPVIERGVQPGQKMHIPAIPEDIDKVPEGFRSGK